MTPVETLEEAANRLEQLLDDMGSWNTGWRCEHGDGQAWPEIGMLTTDDDDPHGMFAVLYPGGEVPGRYIAAMDPRVGRVLADWLRHEAKSAAHHHGAWAQSVHVEREYGGADHHTKNMYAHAYIVASLLLGGSLDRVPGEFKTITDKEN